MAQMFSNIFQNDPKVKMSFKRSKLIFKSAQSKNKFLRSQFLITEHVPKLDFKTVAFMENCPEIVNLPGRLDLSGRPPRSTDSGRFQKIVVAQRLVTASFSPTTPNGQFLRKLYIGILAMKNIDEGRSKLVYKLFLFPLIISVSINHFKPIFPSLSQNLIILVLMFILLSLHCNIFTERKSS